MGRWVATSGIILFQAHFGLNKMDFGLGRQAKKLLEAVADE
jgi:hypothetical protein